ncbi:hypothetical protein VTO42DRAFT_8746 [Malbranchea cinnamomea]
MVLWPCPRLHGGTNSSSNREEDPPGGVVRHPQASEMSSQLSTDQSRRERQEFADIFRPSTPPSRRKMRVPFQPKRTLSRTSNSEQKRLTQKRSRISIISLSSRLRRRFSREINLSKKTSKTQCYRLERNILGSDVDSDAGYDSDAHYLSTPQITQRLDDSPFSVCSRRLRALDLTGEAKQERTTAHGGIGRENQNSTPVHSRQTMHATLCTTPCLRDGGAENTILCVTPADSSVESQAFFTPLNSRSPATVDARIDEKSPPDLDDGSPKRLRSRAEPLRPVSLHTTPERLPPPIPDKSPLREQSRSPNFNGFDKCSGTIPSDPSNRPPSFNLLGPKSWQAIQKEREDNLSGSISSKKTIESGGVVEMTACGQAETAQVGANERSVNYFPGEGTSPKVRLLPSKSFVTRSQSTNLSQLYVTKRNSAAVRQGRFIEEFGHISISKGTTCLARSQTTREHRSSSEGWLSGGRRLGYGYSFVSRADEETAHVLQDAVDNERTGDTSIAVAGSAGEKHSKESLRDRLSGSDIIKPTDSPNHSVLGATASDSKEPRIKRSFSIKSWARFPHSTRKQQRSLPGENGVTEATVTEALSVRANPKQSRKTGQINPWDRLSRGRSILRRRQSSRTEPITNTPAQPGTPTKRNDASSALEELTEKHKDARNSRDALICRERHSSAYSPVLKSAGYDGPLNFQAGHASSLEDYEGADLLTEMTTAEAWSQMYQDCLPHLSMSDEGEAVPAVGRDRPRFGTDERSQSRKGTEKTTPTAISPGSNLGGTIAEV